MQVLFTVAQYAAALATIGATAGMFIKWAIVKPIKLYIDQMTYPIQPTANGGKSLPDLIVKVDEVKDMLNQHLIDHDTPK
jgi:hypothetical protein